MNHNPTVLEIDKKGLLENYAFFRSKIGTEVKFMAVVKANAYGSDAIAVAKALEAEGADYLAVAYLDEGIELREAGVELPILVLHPQLNNLKFFAAYNLEPNLYNMRLLRAFLDLAKAEGFKGYKIHLKFNTGLNRLGFSPNELKGIHALLSQNDLLQVASIFSHLIASEDLDLKEVTLKQIECFEELSLSFESLFGFRPLRHMTNTSGVLNFKSAHFDMVRVGIGLYGLGNDPKWTAELSDVLQLKSVISHTHWVEKNESVGYNLGFIAEQKCQLAVVPIGHADGIHRQLGKGKLKVGIQGVECPIMGNVCMDMIMVDVTGLEVGPGEPVAVFQNRFDLEEMAKACETIPYELLTAMSKRIRRLVR